MQDQERQRHDSTPDFAFSIPAEKRVEYGELCRKAFEKRVEKYPWDRTIGKFPPSNQISDFIMMMRLLRYESDGTPLLQATVHVPFIDEQVEKYQERTFEVQVPRDLWPDEPILIPIAKISTRRAADSVFEQPPLSIPSITQAVDELRHRFVRAMFFLVIAVGVLAFAQQGCYPLSPQQNPNKDAKKAAQSDQNP